MALAPDVEKVVVEVIIRQSLADHLGDVRDEEDKLWKLLGIPPLPLDDPAWDSDSAFRIAVARLRAADRLDLYPSYLGDPNEGSDDA